MIDHLAVPLLCYKQTGDMVSVVALLLKLVMIHLCAGTRRQFGNCIVDDLFFSNTDVSLQYCAAAVAVGNNEIAWLRDLGTVVACSNEQQLHRLVDLASSHHLHIRTIIDIGCIKQGEAVVLLWQARTKRLL